MSSFKFKVAYTTDDTKIQPALDAGTIDAGDLIIKDNSDDTFNLRFIDQEGGILYESGVSDSDITEKIVPAVVEETDDIYVKKDEQITTDQLDVNIINGGSTLDVPEVTSSVASAADLIAAIDDESVTNITLTANITDLEQGLDISNRDLTIDLAGYTISNSVDIWSDTCVSIFTVTNGTLTLTGEGSVVAKEDDCYTLVANENGTIIIEGGTYNGNITTAYLYGDNAAVYINGGTFKIQQLNTNGVESSYGLMINIRNEYRDSAYVEITGGQFEHYNPAAPEEGDLVYLADGYTVEHDETTDIYTVVKEG